MTCATSRRRPASILSKGLQKFFPQYKATQTGREREPCGLSATPAPIHLCLVPMLTVHGGVSTVLHVHIRHIYLKLYLNLLLNTVCTYYTILMLTQLVVFIEC